MPKIIPALMLQGRDEHVAVRPSGTGLPVPNFTFTRTSTTPGGKTRTEVISFNDEQMTAVLECKCGAERRP